MGRGTRQRPLRTNVVFSPLGRPAPRLWVGCAAPLSDLPGLERCTRTVHTAPSGGRPSPAQEMPAGAWASGATTCERPWLLLSHHGGQFRENTPGKEGLAMRGIYSKLWDVLGYGGDALGTLGFDCKTAVWLRCLRVWLGVGLFSVASPYPWLKES